jgi:hypothetical protein
MHENKLNIESADSETRAASLKIWRSEIFLFAPFPMAFSVLINRNAVIAAVESRCALAAVPWCSGPGKERIFLAKSLGSVNYNKIDQKKIRNRKRSNEDGSSW